MKHYHYFDIYYGKAEELISQKFSDRNIRFRMIQGIMTTFYVKNSGNTRHT